MLYFVGGCLSFMEADLGAEKTGSWLPVSNTLAITAVAPFVGYLQDLLGRRNITLAGSVVIMVGIALIGSAHSFRQAVAGMTLSGVGAGICELSALAGYVHGPFSPDAIACIAHQLQTVRHRPGSSTWSCIGSHDSIAHSVHSLRDV